jgi:phosphoribosylformylglycinamidine synthase subunit PurQ / glutaminase
MKSAVVVFPGINRDRDMMRAGAGHRARSPSHQPRPRHVWHGETEIPPVDLIVLPGGFSYGDYLRCGAIAARSPVMGEVARQAARGVNVLGVCNGFQILTEAGLLPGVLMRNAGLKFACRHVRSSVENNRTFLTRRMPARAVVTCPVAHGEGNYFADPDAGPPRRRRPRRVPLRRNTNPNGSINDIAGIVNASRQRPRHDAAPRKHDRPLHGSTDCRGAVRGAWRSGQREPGQRQDHPRARRRARPQAGGIRALRGSSAASRRSPSSASSRPCGTSTAPTNPPRNGCAPCRPRARGHPGPGRERRRHRHRRRPGHRLQDGEPQPSLLHRALSGRGDRRRRHPARRVHHGRAARSRC